jgi:hypothetical protein
MVSSERYSSCLWLLIFGVKRDSFPPNGQQTLCCLRANEFRTHKFVDVFGVGDAIEITARKAAKTA